MIYKAWQIMYLLRDMVLLWLIPTQCNIPGGCLITSMFKNFDKSYTSGPKYAFVAW